MSLLFPTIENAILACPMCMSGGEGNVLMAANSAIGFLLVVILAVLGSFLSFIFHLAKRARMIAAEDQANASGGGES